MMCLSEDEVNDTDADVDVAEDGVVGAQWGQVDIH